MSVAMGGSVGAALAMLLCGGAGASFQARGPIDGVPSRFVIEAQPERPAASISTTEKTHRFRTANPSAQAPSTPQDTVLPVSVGAILELGIGAKAGGMRRIRQDGKNGIIRIDFFRKTPLTGELHRRRRRGDPTAGRRGSLDSSFLGQESSEREFDLMVILETGESARFLESPLLSGIPDDDRMEIFQRLNPSTIPAGSPLLVQGQPNERLWFVLEGTVSIERMQSGGKLDVLATMTAPAIFGTTTYFRSTAPTATIRASTDLVLGTLDREGHDQLRREQPGAAEALALGVLRVLSERFDLMDDRITELMAEHGDDHPRANEWASFRSRLFEEPAL